MVIDTSGLRFPKGQPRVLSKHARLVQQQKKIARAYEIVNARDENRCRVTGVRLIVGSPNDKRRREHHHLSGRCVRPEWITRPRRIILVSAYVHRLLTASALIPDHLDADQPISWRWNRRIVRSGEEPFRLNESET